MSCPTCKGDSVSRYRPFCSKNCANIDLGRWLTESYAVPSCDPEDFEIAQEQIADLGKKPA
jgi:endogenous inhibitor of DNA gyrase (YacG/DUF329 family)